MNTEIRGIIYICPKTNITVHTTSFFLEREDGYDGMIEVCFEIEDCQECGDQHIFRHSL